MLLNIKVISNSGKSKVVEEKDLFKVYVKAPPVDGKANKEVVEVLTEHFKIKKNQIDIIRGKTSNKKTVKVDI